ncbi:MAG: helix-turn-helix transcriptional regulator [Ruminococcaceae bacterium]|nr:helix-turn-helix transcriptional regulator [Oscillospiraceae bacterium]
MEFGEKLQELRKKKGLTQEELADKLYVSRTAVSKWESGRGYPNIESLKAIAKFFSVTIDVLLSGDEVLTIAEEDCKQQEHYFKSLIFGLLDISSIIFFFLPFFGQTVNGRIQEVSLISLQGIAPYLKYIYGVLVIGIVGYGILTLVLQNFHKLFWVKYKDKISLVLSIVATLLFIVSSQPYAATLMFIFLILKAFMLIKR